MAKDIVISLKLKADGGSGETQDAEETSKSMPGDGPLDRKYNYSNANEGSTGKAVMAYAGKQLLSTAMNESLSWAQYYWQRNATLTDNYIAQRDMQIASTMVSKIGGAASTILSSTASGAAIGGPWGAAIGAVVGTIAATANLARGVTEALDQQNIMLQQMEENLNNTRNKVGWSTKAASIGEDL